MHTLSMTTGYAVQALSLITQSPDRYFLIRDIANATGIPAPYLSKIAQGLVDAGLLDSKRGYRGGIKLKIPADQLTVAQIDAAVDMGDARARCLLGGVECNDQRACPVHEFWKQTREDIRAKLNTLTLADVAKFESTRPDFKPFEPVRRERQMPKRYKKRQPKVKDGEA